MFLALEEQEGSEVGFCNAHYTLLSNICLSFDVQFSIEAESAVKVFQSVCLSVNVCLLKDHQIDIKLIITVCFNRMRECKELVCTGKVVFMLAKDHLLSKLVVEGNLQ